MSTPTKPQIIQTRDGFEVRVFRSNLEARDGAGPAFVIEGIAAATSVPYDMGTYDEIVQRGVFADTLAKRPDVQLLVNHQGLPLARTTVPPGRPGHLTLTEDERGLHVIAQLDKSDSDSVTLLRKIQSGLLRSMSFGFRVTKQTWSDDRTLRTIQAVDINRGDVSVVGQPANHATTVDARSRLNGRRPPLSLYVARARALALRDRDLRIRNEGGRR